MSGRGKLREKPKKKDFGDDYIVDMGNTEPNHAAGSSTGVPGVVEMKRDRSRGKGIDPAANINPNNVTNSGASSNNSPARVDATPAQLDRGVNNAITAAISNGNGNNAGPGSNISNDETNSENGVSAGNGEREREVTGAVPDTVQDAGSSNITVADYDLALSIKFSDYDRKFESVEKAVTMLYEALTEEQLNEIENKNKKIIEGNELLKSFIQEGRSAATIRTLSYSKVVARGILDAATTATAAAAVVPTAPDDVPATAAAAAAAAEAKRVANAEAAAAAKARDRHRDQMQRRCNIIIEGIKEEGTGGEMNNWEAIEDIFSYLGCYERGYDIIGEPVRLGDKNYIKYGNYRKPRKYPRLLKVVFNSEKAANEVLRRSTKLSNHYLYGHIYIKRDKSREERNADYAARRKPWGDTQPPEQSEAENDNEEANNREGRHIDNEGEEQNANRVMNDRREDGRSERPSDIRVNSEGSEVTGSIGDFLSSARIIDDIRRDDRGTQGEIDEINTSSTTSEEEVNESDTTSERDVNNSDDPNDEWSVWGNESDSEDNPRETMKYGSQLYIVRSQIADEGYSNREELEDQEGSETEENGTDDLNRDEDMGNGPETENNGGG